MKHYTVFVFWVLLSVQAMAQLQDTMRVVTIEASRFQGFASGNKNAGFDSVAALTFQTQSIAALLASQSQLYVKSYGPALASVSFRGSGAAHTAVLWQGFNLQSPMNGQVDFSLLQSDMNESVTVRYGGNGALFGSGAVGGVVQLQSGAHYDSGLHGSAGVQAGSFGALRYQASLTYGTRNWFTRFKYFDVQSDNDFSFTNTSLPGKPIEKQTNAAVAQTGFLNEHYFKLSPRQHLNINFWYQYANRQIPPVMSVPQSGAAQVDESYRSTAEWKYLGNKVTWMARTAWFREVIDYTDPVTLVAGYNLCNSSISEVESRMQISNNHSVNIGLNHTYAHAFSDGYGGWVSQQRTALFASYKWVNTAKTLSATVSGRQEVADAVVVPFIPSLGAEWKPNKTWKVYGNISRSYRLPTLNERFWVSAQTQPTVKPESGWGEELGTSATAGKNKFTITGGLTAFNRLVQNWIVWQPAGSGWAPQNIKEVWSRGLEGDGGVLYKLSKVAVSYKIQANYILSTNKASAIPNDASVDCQLIYVPRLTHQHQFMVRFTTFHVGYLHAYTGMRYTTSDNKQWLNDYALGTLVADKVFKYKQTSFTLTAQLNNCWDITYQAIADRPMPGRNFLVSGTIKF